MLSPVKFDDVAIPFMSTWSETYDPVEFTEQTEAGTDVIVIIRGSKLRVDCGGRYLSSDVKLLEKFRPEEKRKFTLTLSDGTTHEVRMRGYSKSRVQKSETIADTSGIWDVSFSLIEF